MMLYLKIHHQTQDHQDFLLCCLLEVFLIWGCKFRSMIIWGSIFVKSVRSVSRFFLLCVWMSSCSAPFVEKTILVPFYCLCLFFKDHLTIFVWVYFWALYSVPLTYLSILSSVPHCLYYCNFIVSVVVG